MEHCSVPVLRSLHPPWYVESQLFAVSLSNTTKPRLLEIPSNVLLKKFSRPSVYIGILVTTWGIVMTLHGVVRNFAGLLVVRLLLGVFEYVLR